MRVPVLRLPAKCAALLSLLIVSPILLLAQTGTNQSVSRKTAPGKTVNCASCHVAIGAAQPRTSMGRAAALTPTNPILRQHPRMTFTRGGYTYTIESKAGESTYTVSDGTGSISVPIHWGIGDKSQTWVLEHDGKTYESLVSYYDSIDALQVTTGAEGLKPTTLVEALGREQSPNDMKACYGCHTTNSAPNGHLDLSHVQTGLTCEHCHTGAAAHQAESILGRFTHLPPDLSKLTSEDLSSFCGQCHRTWELVVRSRWRGGSNVRFQPYRLANSRCFSGTDARIGCIACHDPHNNLVKDQAYYDQKCLACHSAAPATPPIANAALSTDRNPKPCPVAKSGCVQCHMPKVDLPGNEGRLKFTDHQIRVVKPGEPYPN